MSSQPGTELGGGAAERVQARVNLAAIERNCARLRAGLDVRAGSVRW